MNVTSIRELPRVGSSWQFAGKDHGDVPFSFYLVEAQSGRGAALHVHDYDEVILVQSGRSRAVLDTTVCEAGPGDILVIKAGTPHGFVNIGAEPLVQIDMHAKSMFHQTNLPPTEISIAAGLPR